MKLIQRILHSAEGATVKQLCMRTNILCYRMLFPRDTSCFRRMSIAAVLMNIESLEHL